MLTSRAVEPRARGKPGSPPGVLWQALAALVDPANKGWSGGVPQSDPVHDPDHGAALVPPLVLLLSGDALGLSYTPADLGDRAGEFGGAWS
ncbi:hypothetical protein GCM10010303_39920 [Streptomyces purpurascens]|nr:hypothetical protein GCM10010303_39920 [Streptomyces purpurascens]